MVSRKAQASTFGIESLVRIAISVFIGAFLLLVIIILVGLVTSQGKGDGTAKNVFKEFINVIEAQEGDEWETKTLLYLPPSYAIIGFGEETKSITYYDSAQAQPIPKPTTCRGSCICLYQSKIITCEDIDADKLLMSIGNSNEALYIRSSRAEETPQFSQRLERLFSISFQEEQLIVSRISSTQGIQETSDGTTIEEGCDIQTTCCYIISSPQDDKCLGERPGIIEPNMGTGYSGQCTRVEVGTCRYQQIYVGATG